MIERAILRKLHEAEKQDVKQQNLAFILKRQFSILTAEGLVDVPVEDVSPATPEASAPDVSPVEATIPSSPNARAARR